MLIVVGLGNPGDEYRTTFHNVGFCAVDLVAEHFGKKIDNKECACELVCFSKNNEKIVLAKPQTYMNLSGTAVASLMKKYGATEKEVLVVVDDIDTPCGEIKIRPHGSASTHNGLRDIVAKIKSQEFLRIRIGTGPVPEKMDLADFVLSSFAKNKDVYVGIDKAKNCIIDYIENRDVEEMSQKYNGKAGKC